MCQSKAWVPDVPFIRQVGWLGKYTIMTASVFQGNFNKGLVAVSQNKLTSAAFRDPNV